MVSSPSPEFNQSQANDSPTGKNRAESSSFKDLYNDSAYLKVIDLFQVGDFAMCEKLLDDLERDYPGHPALENIRGDLQLRLSLKKVEASTKKRERRQRTKATFNLGVFAIVGTILALAATVISFYYLSQRTIETQTDQTISQITQLNAQVEQLLAVGNPQPALEIIEKMKLIDPEFENLPSLTSKTEQLVMLESKYQAALKLVDENQLDEALRIFNEIETEKPGIWDVANQIKQIETTKQIASLLESGNTAYQNARWDQVISDYEGVLTLDPNFTDPYFREQLLNSYLNQIIAILQNENTVIEEIEITEQYYRKALALIPQSKEFANERGNLQEVTANLLILKFSQTGKAFLEDKNQTISSISKAVSFIRKAANLNPKNTALQADLKNAEYYQIAFQQIRDMDWVQAISNLKEVVSRDANYAAGNANILLFEAYYALGKQYYAAGFWLDALKNLEQAEILAYDDIQNLLKLIQIQTLIGDVYAETDDYEKAVSYYQYIANLVVTHPRANFYPQLSRNFASAALLAEGGDFYEAYMTYQEAFKDVPMIYNINEVEINSGVSLALFASQYSSTMDAIIESNNLPKSTAITFGRLLQVPSLQK